MKQETAWPSESAFSSGHCKRSDALKESGWATEQETTICNTTTKEKETTVCHWDWRQRQNEQPKNHHRNRKTTADDQTSWKQKTKTNHQSEPEHWTLPKKLENPINESTLNNNEMNNQRWLNNHFFGKSPQTVSRKTLKKFYQTHPDWRFGHNL